MFLTEKLKVEDVVDDIELDPKKADHKNWDALVAVAMFLRAHYDGSKPTDGVGDDDDRCNLQVANQGAKRKPSNNDREDNVQKHLTRKRRCYSNAGFEEDYLSHGEEECGNYNSKTKKKRCRGRSENKKGGKKAVIEVSYPPPNMPTKFMNRVLEMGGTDIKLVIQKALSCSDCKKDQNRLFISILDAADFLNEKEKELLQRDARVLGDKQSIDVVLLPPDLKETDITLRQYNLKKTNGNVSRQYVLNKPWHDVVVRNGLVENTIIQIWSFRVDGKLGLAIVNSGEAKN